MRSTLDGKFCTRIPQLFNSIFFINIVYFYQWIGAAHSIRWSKIVFLPFPPFLHLFGTCFESSSFRCEKEKKCYPHKTETQQDHCLVIKPLTSSQKTTLLLLFLPFSAFWHKKRGKRIIQPAFRMCSTQLLFEIYKISVDNYPLFK